MKAYHAIVALCALASANARTATKQVDISAQLSPADKEAAHRAMVHTAFANAGRKAGIEIWRIENFEPVPVPTRDFGKFYKGDSYIVLKTSADKKGNLSWDIHYWIGSKSTQDESGAAAILTVGLDDKFGGAPVQHRETEGHESSQFLGYFKPAIRYLDGGHDSGFHHVTTNAGAEKRLFQVKGKKNVRVRQVEPSVASMNKGDCFILDVDQTIYVYVGEKARILEKMKANSIANQIRDQDHNGRGKVEIIDQYSSDADFEKFFSALGSGSRSQVPAESNGGDDQAFENSQQQSVTLSEISDSSGQLKATPLSKPYKQEQLKSQECYILDTASGSIYVWVGKGATEREKTEAMSKAQQYLSSKKYPPWVHVSRVPEGAEPAVFKQYFTTWRDVNMKHSRIVRSASDEEYFGGDETAMARQARVVGKTGSARGFMPDDGSAMPVVYRIEDMEPVRLFDPENSQSLPALYQGDCYLIVYEYTGYRGRGYVIYYWIGKNSTQDEQAAAAIHAVAKDSELAGKAVIVRVPQGEEPKHFLKIFKGRLVTLLGGKASGFKNVNVKDEYDLDGTRLFRVYGSEAGEDMRAEQVAEKASSLTSDDVYLLETPNIPYLWFGKDSSDEERDESLKFLHQILGKDKDHVTIHQGEESNEFWQSLEGDDSVVPSSGLWRDKVDQRINADPRLYEVLFRGNRIDFEEISEFQQKDLESEDVCVLDTGDELYVWIGSDASPDAKKKAFTVATHYLRRRGLPENSRVAMVIKQELEPKLFKRMFEEWDEHMWTKQKHQIQEKLSMLENNEIEK